MDIKAMTKNQDRTRKELEAIFPKLAQEEYEIVKSESPLSNCVSDVSRKADPFSASNRCTANEFIASYEREGWRLCKSGELESEFVKLAIYVGLYKRWTHVCRQLKDGRWRHKLGQRELIVTTSVGALEGWQYGACQYFMSRPRTENDP